MCIPTCYFQRCALCTQCLHASQKVTLREAYLEHYNRGGCRRLIPPAIVSRTCICKRS
ncbi:hypothetical protein DPMN_153502 [Dreissena polymorpha]|uniref:Uncharacterized protein n=1 Tax=Dreissena polymorpha TaxID=45954 RepID=A0A9D4FJA6_DREPO|nr:hypothetical protein DPMN_153502 [Dreissena polymorpha]